VKTIGLIGGMSWESSVLYYQLINRKVNEVPTFDTTIIHAEKAVELALEK
jgi:aspartate/glutamate racemase